jgi:phosphohistidine phosphatase
VRGGRVGAVIVLDVARTLVIVRHAKAVQEGATDEARVLADRGLADAAAAGRWLAKQGLIPDRVVVSPARRAIQTWDAVATDLGASPVVVVDDRVYDNTVDALLSVVHDTPDDIATLAMVGHNPSMHALVLGLDDGNGEPEARAAIAEKYPTSGIAVMDVDTGWADLAHGGATIRSFTVPRA